MWPRWCETAIALWLLLSVPLFGGGGALDAHLVPGVAALVVMGLAAAAYRRPFAHAFVPVVGLALAAWAWGRFPRPGPAVAQNAIVIGLLLALFGIVPTRSDRPPPGWRAHVRDDP